MKGVDMGNRETTATFIGGGDMGNTGAHCYIHGRGGYVEYRSSLLHPWKGWIGESQLGDGCKPLLRVS
jgi:hypothetical protein